MFKVPESLRAIGTSNLGNNGIFVLLSSRGGSHRRLVAVASDGFGWEHVSVHGEFKNANDQYTPSWDEMQLVKQFFWGDEDVVMQIHPAKSNYVNIHHHVLHLWRPVNLVIPTPPVYLV